MNLYKLSQDFNDGYDTYDSAIVAAESAEKARTIPVGSSISTWVQVILIGKAEPGIEEGIILASFNAG